MRTRVANPHREAHGRNLLVAEWIAPPGVDPLTLPTVLEAVVSTLHLEGSSGEQHGFINTSLRPDGSLYVAVHLHQSGCAQTAGCQAGHDGVRITAAPELTSEQLAAMVAAVGEADGHVLEGSEADQQVLDRLGFSDQDSPYRSGALGLTSDELDHLRAAVGSEAANALHEGDHDRACEMLGLPADTHPFSALTHVMAKRQTDVDEGNP